MLPFIRIQVHKGSLDCLRSQPLHLLQDTIIKILPSLQLIILVEVTLELLVTDLVAFLILAVLL